MTAKFQTFPKPRLFGCAASQECARIGCPHRKLRGSQGEYECRALRRFQQPCFVHRLRIAHQEADR